MALDHQPLDLKTALDAARAVEEELLPISDAALVGELLRRRARQLELQGILRNPEKLCRDLHLVLRGQDAPKSFNG